MSGSSHIRSVLIGVEYWNCCWTLDIYLLFAILSGQIKSKVNYRLVTYNWSVHKLQMSKSVLIEFAPSKLQKVNKHPKFNNNFNIWHQLEHIEYDMNQTLKSRFNCLRVDKSNRKSSKLKNRNSIFNVIAHVMKCKCLSSLQKSLISFWLVLVLVWWVILFFYIYLILSTICLICLSILSFFVSLMSGSCHMWSVEIVVELGIFVVCLIFWKKSDRK